MKYNTEILTGIRGQFYQHQTQVIKKALEENCDASWKNSPAKEIAAKSAETWEHSGSRHVNNIETFDYAVFRQYECGNNQKAVLLEFTENDKQEMLMLAAQDLGTQNIGI